MSNVTILIHAYRLGVLDMALALDVTDEPIPGSLRQAFEEERSERLAELIAECGEGDWAQIRIGGEEE